MKLSRYEDSPYAKHMQSKGHNESFETLWQVTEIDFEEGYVYDSGSMKYDADSDGKLDTMPYAQRAKIKSHNKSQGIYISESEYNIPQEIVMEVNLHELKVEVDGFLSSLLKCLHHLV